jgi:hypothetical protein
MHGFLGGDDSSRAAAAPPATQEHLGTSAGVRERLECADTAAAAA